MTKITTSIVSIGILVALALPLNLALAQTDPLANLFSGNTNSTPAAEPVTTSNSDTTTTTPTATDPTSSKFLDDVVNVTAEAGDASVILRWDAVPGADHYTVHYGTQSIREIESRIYPEVVKVGNVTEYEVAKLTPGKYFFAITAEDTLLKVGSQFYSDEIGVVLTATEVASADTKAIIKEGSKEEPSHSAAPTTLPQSGPAATIILVWIAVLGSYLWHRRNSLS